jgi:hypothetical protein
VNGESPAASSKRQTLNPGKSIVVALREIRVSESNANNRCCTGNIGNYWSGLRRIYGDAPKEGPRSWPDPSDKERARDYSDSTDRLLGRHRRRRHPDLCRFAQDHLGLPLFIGLLFCGCTGDFCNVKGHHIGPIGHISPIRFTCPNCLAVPSFATTQHEARIAKRQTVNGERWTRAAPGLRS